MPSEGSDGIGIGESEAVAHAQRGFVGFEAGVFQASPVVVAVAGVQGQAGRDVYAYACHCAEAQAADAAAFVMGKFGDRTTCGNTWLSILWVSGNSNGFSLNRTNLMSDVSVGDACADIGFEFIVEFEIVNGGQAERRNGVERTVFLIYRLPVCPVAIVLVS